MRVRSARTCGPRESKPLFMEEREAYSPAQAYQVREAPMKRFIGVVHCRFVIGFAL